MDILTTYEREFPAQNELKMISTLVGLVLTNSCSCSRLSIFITEFIKHNMFCDKDFVLM